MTYLLDTNVLLALAWENHTLHAKAHRWFSGVKDFATCPISQSGFVRISINPKLGYSQSAAEAIEFLESLEKHPSHQFWPDDLSMTALAGQMDRHSQVTDFYLAALAKSKGGKLATLDGNIPESLFIG